MFEDYIIRSDTRIVFDVFLLALMIWFLWAVILWGAMGVWLGRQRKKITIECLVFAVVVYLRKTGLAGRSNEYYVPCIDIWSTQCNVACHWECLLYCFWNCIFKMKLEDKFIRWRGECNPCNNCITMLALTQAWTHMHGMVDNRVYLTEAILGLWCPTDLGSTL